VLSLKEGREAGRTNSHNVKTKIFSSILQQKPRPKGVKRKERGGSLLREDVAPCDLLTATRPVLTTYFHCVVKTVEICGQRQKTGIKRN
jgi:hypothetical protein